MATAFRAFMQGLIDYAGLFPPAVLPPGRAVARYAGHRAGPQAWMLGRFIAPAEKLAEIGAARANVPGASAAGAWECSVLIGSREGAAEALEALAPQGAAILAAEEEGWTGIQVLEYPLPHATGAGRQVLADHLDLLFARLEAAGLAGRELFLELPPGSDDAGVIEILAARGEGAPVRRLGVKLRCGGLRPENVPAVSRVAGILAACARSAVPLKCTAGLHHPVRHLADEPEVMMHGFFNVFGAGLLAASGQASGRELESCVAETDPAAFSFTEEAFAWRHRAVAADRIEEIRRRSLCGFGSCSFAEPVADLQALGLL
ncbi:MAG: hypothetical protein AB7V45_08270 [Candidatus Krumholzibacteriia bacterium]